jgi:hypothetical protein
MLDKENSLTFQNITHTMKLNRARKNSNCHEHPERPAKYRNRGHGELYCVPCAIQEASRGAVIDDLSKNPALQRSHAGLNLLQEIYQRSQQQLQEYIALYNSKYQKLLDSLTDMQIRDLIGFNRKIEEVDPTLSRTTTSTSDSRRKAQTPTGIMAALRICSPASTFQTPSATSTSFMRKSKCWQLESSTAPLKLE